MRPVPRRRRGQVRISFISVLAPSVEAGPLGGEELNHIFRASSALEKEYALSARLIVEHPVRLLRLIQSPTVREEAI